MARWITSDFHFNHKNICGPYLSEWDSGFRNFSSLNEMNNTILNNLNSVVLPGDELYFLGDFAFGDKEKIPELRGRIACHNIHLLYGNHDGWLENKCPEVWRELSFRSYGHYKEIRINKRLVVMQHYPLAVWNEAARGSVMLHGHSHGNYKAPGGRIFDVGVDTNGFMSYDLDMLVERLTKKEVDDSLDHHKRSQKGW